MEFKDIIKKVKKTEYLGYFDVIEHRECIKNLVIFESEADKLEKDIPEPWFVRKKEFNRAKDDSPTLVKINIFNRVADAINDMVMYDNINESDVELLKEYPDITKRIIERKYEDLDKSISKIKEDKKGKLIPIMNKAKACLEEIGRRLN
ncbi:hypothetical protein [Clostridium subterminale]|uniref:Uncharacterized protein n=1 Tax=Clostridium subterminale TaxID=1550 RepID=A0ABN1KUX2_CLOSU